MLFTAVTLAFTGPPLMGGLTDPVFELGGASYRVQSLSPTLLRVERKGEKGFEDRNTFLVANRPSATRPFKSIEQPNSTCALLVTTESLMLTLQSSNASDLRLILAEADGSIICKVTLDRVPQEPPLPTPAELAAAAGKRTVFALRDAPRFVPATADMGPTPAPKGSPYPNTSGFDVGNDAADAYLFVATADDGHAPLRRAVLDLTGDVPRLPDYAFGLWYTWYHPYTQAEKTAEVQRFVDDRIPLDVASLDMDWREEPEERTGYQVNTDDFPDMRGFLAWLHSIGKVAFFNDHPMSKAPHLSPKEVSFRYDGLTSMLQLGLDFWWFDCHWSNVMPPLKIGNDSAEVDYMAWGQAVFRATQLRWRRAQNLSDANTTLTLGCSDSNHWANHRTPVWWTGDNQWDQLTAEVEKQVTYGLQLKPYVHMDCTGHHGPEDHGHAYPPEPFVRWIQFCSLGTIMRIHSDPKVNPGTNYSRQPWAIGMPHDGVEDLVRAFVDMRYKLVPTLVAAAARVTDGDGMPLVRRLDLEWPAEPNATRTDQYLLGDDLLVAPIDPFAQGGGYNATCWTHLNPPFCNTTGWNRRRDVYLPPADGWIDAFSGAEHAANQTIELVNVSLSAMPLFHRRGGLVVLAKPRALSTAQLDMRELIVEAYAAKRDSRVVRVARRTAAITTEGPDGSSKRHEGRDEREEHEEHEEHEELLEWVRAGPHLTLSISPAVAPWVVRVRLPQGEAVSAAAVNGMAVTPLRLGAAAEGAMPFGGPGDAAVGADMVELRLKRGQGRVELKLRRRDH